MTYQNVHPRNWPRSKAEPFSASLAGTLNLADGYSISVSLSRSERMPSVREISASSNSLATSSFKTGTIKGYGSLHKDHATIKTETGTTKRQVGTEGVSTWKLQ